MVTDFKKVFMELLKLNFMPEFIQEVGDFEPLGKEYIRNGLAKLIGLEDMYLFKFYVDNKG